MEIISPRTRQLDLISEEALARTPIHVIGAGAIGSFTTLALSKMGVQNLHAWDFDEVSIYNMNCQFYRTADIDTPKVTALTSLVHSFTGEAITGHNTKFEAHHGDKLSGIVILAVDKMDARRMIVDAIAQSGFNTTWIIDPRMGAEYYTQLTVNPWDEKSMEWYGKYLFSEGEVMQEKCTAKSTVYTALLASGLVVKTVKNLLMKQDYPKRIEWDISSAASPLMMGVNYVP